MILNDNTNGFTARKICLAEIVLLLNIRYNITHNNLRIDEKNGNRNFQLLNFSNGIIIPEVEFSLIYEAFYLEDLLIKSVNDNDFLNTIGLSFKEAITISKKYFLVLKKLSKMTGLLVSVEKALKKYLTNNFIFRFNGNFIGKSAVEILQNEYIDLDITYYSENGEDKNIMECFSVDLNNFKNNNKYKFLQCLQPTIIDGCVREIKIGYLSVDD